MMAQSFSDMVNKNQNISLIFQDIWKILFVSISQNKWACVQAKSTRLEPRLNFGEVKRSVTLLPRHPVHQGVGAESNMQGDTYVPVE